MSNLKGSTILKPSEIEKCYADNSINKFANKKYKKILNEGVPHPDDSALVLTTKY